MASQDHGIHSFEECVLEGSDYFQHTLGRVHIRRSSAHNKRKRRWEQLKIKLSRSKEDPSSDEEYRGHNSWRTSYPYYHLDKKRCCYGLRRWWSWRLKKDSTHEKNKYKYSIVISWYCFVMHLLLYYAW